MTSIIREYHSLVLGGISMRVEREGTIRETMRGSNDQNAKKIQEEKGGKAILESVIFLPPTGKQKGECGSQL